MQPRSRFDLPTSGYTVEFHPGVRASSQAAPVLVAPGATTTVSLVMTKYPLHRVEGRVSTGDAPLPERVHVALHVRDPGEPGDGPELASCVADAFGGFVLPPVAAGAYVLTASARPDHDRFPLRADTPLDVSGDTQVDVELLPGAIVRGRIRFVGVAPAALERFQLEASAIESGELPARSSPIGADGAFEVAGLRGRVRFAIDQVPHDEAGRPQGISIARVRLADGTSTRREVAPLPGVVAGAATGPSSPARGTPTPAVGAPDGPTTFTVPVEEGVTVAGPAWRTRAVRVNGVVVPDGVVDVDERRLWHGVEIEVAHDYALVSGLVRDDRGAPVKGATIVALAAGSDDEALPPTRWASRDEGRYTATAIPPGTWDIVAIDDVPQFGIFDDVAAFLARVRSAARRVVLASGQRRELDLVVVSP